MAAGHHNPAPDEAIEIGDNVLYEKHDRIAHVTINRPDARNAVSPGVHREMIAVWRDFSADESVDVAILTGAGDEAFCAGRISRSTSRRSSRTPRRRTCAR